jgi:hypothetical protein
METPVFPEKSTRPDERHLAEALGKSGPRWEEIRAVAAVEASGLPEGLIAELKSAKKYAEGRGLRIEVKTKADVRSVLELIEIKAAN